MINIILQFMLPVLCGTVAILYFRRASIGLERHLKKVSCGFLILTVFEILSLSSLFRQSIDIKIFEMVAPYGILSICSYIVLFVAIVVLSSWTWYYLLKRLSTQLFMLLMSLVVVLSLVVTGTFVSLLFKSVETESLIKLRSNAEVTTSLLEEKKLRIKSEMKQFALNSEVIKAVEEGNRQVLSDMLKKQMELTGTSSMVIVDSSGKVIIRGENEEERGTSLSSDKYIEKALRGESPAGYFVASGTISPVVSLHLATPMTGGAIMTSYTLDNVFVDGIKNSTGLSISLYGDKTLAATTEEIGNSKTRLSGIKEVDSEVLSRVWDKGEIYTTASTLGEREYLSAYVPLKDQNNEVVAVMQVAQQEAEAMQAAGQAVQMTFGFIILIMVMLAWPLSMISKKLVKEWE